MECGIFVLYGWVFLHCYLLHTEKFNETIIICSTYIGVYNPFLLVSRNNNTAKNYDAIIYLLKYGMNDVQSKLFEMIRNISIMKQFV